MWNEWLETDLCFRSIQYISMCVIARYNSFRYLQQIYIYLITQLWFYFYQKKNIKKNTFANTNLIAYLTVTTHIIIFIIIIFIKY